MKRRFVCLILMIAAAIGLCACGKKEVQQESEVPVTEMTLSALQYSDGNTTVRFSNVENVWKWADGLDFPLDDTFVLQMVDDVKALLQLDSVGKMDDAATYGLDSAQKYVSVTDEEKTITLSFGKQNSEGKWYFSRDDQPDLVYLAEDNFVQKLSTPVYQLAVLPQLPEFSEENICAVTLDQDVPLHLHLTLKEGKWFSGGSAFAADGLEKELENLTITECVDYLPSSGAVSLCGFDMPLTVTVSYTNSVDTQSDWQLYVGNISLDGEGYYVSFNEDTTIYLMPKENLTTILKLAEDNRQDYAVGDTELYPE